jgi:hypothetical protein
MKGALTRLSRNDAGMTIIELIVVCTLLPVILGAGYLLLEAGNTIANQTDARQQATDQSRDVLAKLTTELRQAVEISEGDGAFAVAQPRQCEFYSDVDHDNVPELVQYRVSGTSLVRSVAHASTISPPFTYGAFSTETTVATGMPTSWTGAVFTYYDGSATPAVVPPSQMASASAVSIRLVNSATTGKNTVQVDLGTWVKVRSIHNSID